MNDYHNPYNRYYIYRMLLAYGQDESMESLSAKTHIPIQIVRNDFYIIFQWFQSDIFINDDSTEYQQACKLFNLEQLLYGEADSSAISKKGLETHIKAGHLDNLPITLDDPQKNSFGIQFDRQELEALYKMGFFEFSKSDFESNYKIKDSSLFEDTYSVKINFIQSVDEALENGDDLLIRYKSPDAPQIQITPVKILYDSIENKYAILAWNKQHLNVFRLDRVCDLSPEMPKPDTKYPPLPDYLNEVWGFCIQEPSSHVKIRFYNEANVWGKVRSALANRPGRLFEENGYLYYEGPVRGISNFRKWLFTFGSSAIVIEPMSLRQKIIQSLTDRLI